MLLSTVRDRRYVTIISTLLAVVLIASCKGPRSTPTSRSADQPTPTQDKTTAVAASGQEATATTKGVAGATHRGLPLSNFSTADFAGSAICAVCHGGLADSAGRDVSIDAHWRSTMMANAATDPLWQAKVSSEVARNPQIRDVIESKCATCHMPMAYTQATVDDLPTRMLDEGFLNPQNSLHDAAMDGVSCTLCHQVQDEALGQDETYSGQFPIDHGTTRPDRIAFGPFPSPLLGPMRSMSGFIPEQARQISDPGLCATCHTLYTPVLDAAGEVVGQFPEQVVYLEWGHSAYGDGADQQTTCQQCHMPAAEGAVVISNRPRMGMLQPRRPFSQHHFVGGNAFMSGILASFVEELALTTSTARLADTLQRTVDQLEGMTARLTILNAVVEDDVLVIELMMENLAGHKLPGGFPSRRAWVHMIVSDGEGRVVFESGQPQPEGRIAGNDADEDDTRYEPHHEVIRSSDQVQVYEAVMGDVEGRVTHTLLRAARYLKDSRLLPRGFDKATAREDFAVQGNALSDEDFVGGSDSIVLEIGVAERSGPFTILVELLYQSVSYPFAQDLLTDDTTLVNRFERYYYAVDQDPIRLASARRTTGAP